MHLRLLAPLAAFALAKQVIFEEPAESVTIKRPVISAYWAGYSAGTLPVKGIPWTATGLTHLDFFVAESANDPARLDLSATWNYDPMLKELIASSHARQVTVGLCIGGWTGSIYFSSLVSNDWSRKTYAATIVNFVKKYSFDSIEIDWEYPNETGAGNNLKSPSDVQNFLAFLKVLRNLVGTSKAISLAVSASGMRGSDGKILRDASPFAQVVDFFKIMGYDMGGNWPGTPVSVPNAPLKRCSSLGPGFSVTDAVDYWINAGIPPGKIVLGMPLYGNQFSLKNKGLASTPNYDGSSSKLYQSLFNNFSPLSWQVTYNSLVGRGILSNTGAVNPNSGYIKIFDNCTMTPFLYNQDKNVLITYESIKSIRAKTLLAQKRGLAGVTVFELSNDYEGKLVKAANEILNPSIKMLIEEEEEDEWLSEEWDLEYPLSTTFQDAK